MSGYCQECGNQHCICGMPEANGVNAVLADVLAEIKTFEYTSSEGDVVVFVEDVENILSKYFR
jgi:hypothetical protein